MVLVKGGLNKEAAPDNTPLGRIGVVEDRILNSNNYISLYYIKGVTRQAGALQDADTKVITLRTAKFISEALSTPLQDVREAVAISEIRLEAVNKLIDEIKREIRLTLAVGGDSVGNLPIDQAIKCINNFSKMRKDKFINLDLTTHTDILGKENVITV